MHVCAAAHVVPQPPQFIVSPAVSTHCEPQHAPPAPHRSPGARGSSHGMHTPETQNSSMPGQSSSSQHVQPPPPVASHTCPGAHGEQPTVPAAHALLAGSHVHAPAVHVWPHAHVVPQPPQFNSSVLLSRQEPLQHCWPEWHALPLVLAPPHGRQLPLTHTSVALGQSAVVVQPHWPAEHVLPLAQGEQIGVAGEHNADAVPQTQLAPEQVSPAAQAVPQLPQCAASVFTSVAHAPPQQVNPLVQSWLLVPSPPQGTQLPVMPSMPVQASVGFRQSSGESQVQPAGWHTCPGAHGVQPAVPGAHAIASDAHVHAPPTQVSPLSQVVPQPPQFDALVWPLTQLPAQHSVPLAAHDLPAVLALPHATHAPPTHTWSAFGQPAEVVHVHTPEVHACPMPHAPHSAVPGAHAFSCAPQVHLPATHASPQPQRVPQPPQLSSSVCGSVQPSPQHSRPEPQAMPLVPVAPHVLHALPAHTLVVGDGQSATLVQAQVPPAHERSPGQGEHAGVPGAHASESPAQVHSPSTQVEPVTHCVSQPPQLPSSVRKSTQPSPQQVPPPAQPSPGSCPTHAAHEPLKQISSAAPQSAVVKHVHAPAVQLSPGAHALQSKVPMLHATAAPPHEHSPATHVCANAQVVPQPPQLVSCVSSSMHAPPQQSEPSSHARPSLPGKPHSVHWPLRHVRSGDGQSAAVVHPQPPARQPSDGAHGVHSSVPAGHAIFSAPQAHLPSEHVSPAAQVVPHPPQLSGSLSLSMHSCPQQAPPASPQSVAPRHATHTPASVAHTPALGGHSLESEHGMPSPPLSPASIPASVRGAGPLSVGVVASAVPTEFLPESPPPSGFSFPLPASLSSPGLGANVVTLSSCLAQPAASATAKTASAKSEAAPVP